MPGTKNEYEIKLEKQPYFKPDLDAYDTSNILSRCKIVGSFLVIFDKKNYTLSREAITKDVSQGVFQSYIISFYDSDGQVKNKFFDFRNSSNYKGDDFEIIDMLQKTLVDVRLVIPTLKLIYFSYRDTSYYIDSNSVDKRHQNEFLEQNADHWVVFFKDDNAIPSQNINVEFHEPKKESSSRQSFTVSLSFFQSKGIIYFYSPKNFSIKPFYRALKSQGFLNDNVKIDSYFSGKSGETSIYGQLLYEIVNILQENGAKIYTTPCLKEVNALKTNSDKTQELKENTIQLQEKNNLSPTKSSFFKGQGDNKNSELAEISQSRNVNQKGSSQQQKQNNKSFSLQ